MSRYSAFDKTTQQWGVITWHKQVIDADADIARYVISVGERLVGEVWSMSDGWTAIAWDSHLLGLRMVKGFRTRWTATDYILEIAVRPERV